MDDLAKFGALTQDLPHLEVEISGCPDGYRAVAVFGDLAFSATDQEMDWAQALAVAGLEAMISARRD